MKVIPYKTLNDAARLLGEGFDRGCVEVWYMKPEWFPKGIVGDDPDPTNLQATHVLLGKIASPLYPEMLWVQLQGENWSPNGEAKLLIESKGLHHTSMSIGDCFALEEEVYVVKATGFKLLSRTPQNKSTP